MRTSPARAIPMTTGVAGARRRSSAPVKKARAEKELPLHEPPRPVRHSKGNAARRQRREPLRRGRAGGGIDKDNALERKFQSAAGGRNRTYRLVVYWKDSDKNVARRLTVPFRSPFVTASIAIDSLRVDRQA